MNFLSILSITTPCNSYLLYLSLIPSLYSAWTAGRLDNFSKAPLLITFLFSSLMLRYGFATGSSVIINTHSVGFALRFGYLSAFLLLCRNKGSMIRSLGITLALLLAILGYYSHLAGANGDLAIQHLGLVTSIVNIATVASPLASLGDVIKNKSTGDLPFPFILLNVTSCIQWVTLGVIFKDNVLIVPNFIGFLLGSAQLALFAIYPAQKQQKEE